ncbi:hypothetical protein ACFSCU_07185 [Ottowia beijingensis]|jgi:hypothetical protein
MILPQDGPMTSAALSRPRRMQVSACPTATRQRGTRCIGIFFIVACACPATFSREIDMKTFISGRQQLSFLIHHQDISFHSQIETT